MSWANSFSKFKKKFNQFRLGGPNVLCVSFSYILRSIFFINFIKKSSQISQIFRYIETEFLNLFWKIQAEMTWDLSLKGVVWAKNPSGIILYLQNSSHALNYVTYRVIYIFIFQHFLILTWIWKKITEFSPIPDFGLGLIFSKLNF